jgi:hypothetical protein
LELFQDQQIILKPETKPAETDMYIKINKDLHDISASRDGTTVPEFHTQHPEKERGNNE